MDADGETRGQTADKIDGFGDDVLVAQAYVAVQHDIEVSQWY